ncbi:MAG: hypothetical protein LYZ69_05625 [Nitrososphaerales archaeon]|nr:hypothetical protein [Nitrososphaerales archaeon]
MVETRKLATATLFGAAIFVLRTLLPPPFSDLFLVVEAFFLGLSFILLGRGGATYTELINGLLASYMKVNFFPFSLLLALLYGVLVDVFASLLRVKSGASVRTKSLIVALTLASIITGPVAYYATVFVTALLPNDPSIYASIIVFGIFSGAIGGYFAVKVWERNLKARFSSTAQQQS